MGLTCPRLDLIGLRLNKFSPNKIVNKYTLEGHNRKFHKINFKY